MAGGEQTLLNRMRVWLGARSAGKEGDGRTEPERTRSITSWGRLYAQDSRELLANVTCIIYFSRSYEMSLGDWWGALRPMRLYGTLSLGEGYCLELNSGRRGEIVITSLGSIGGQPYFFQGLGSLND